MADFVALAKGLRSVIEQHMKSAIAEIFSKQMETLVPDIVNFMQEPTRMVPTFDDKNFQPSVDTNDQPLSGANVDPNLKPNPQMDDLNLVPARTISFQDAVAPPPACGDPTHAMTAQRKGDYLSIRVDDSLVQNGISRLQNSLIGRLVLSSSEKPYTLDDLKLKLSKV